MVMAILSVPGKDVERTGNLHDKRLTLLRLEASLCMEAVCYKCRESSEIVWYYA